MNSHSKRSLWAAAAVGALMLGSSTTALAQSMPDTSVSRSTVGQEAKFSAVIDSLKAAGIAQQNAEAATAIGQAGIAAMQAQETAREQANFAAGQAGLAAQAQANNAGTTGNANVASPTGSSLNAQVDALKAAGIQQQNAEAAAAIGQAGIAAMQAQETAREQANFAAGQAGLAAQASSNASTTGNASVAPTGNSQLDALRAAGMAQQNAEAAAAIGQAGIAAQQAQESAREQANFDAGQAGLAAQAQANGGSSASTAGAAGHTSQGSQRNAERTQ